MFKPLVEKFKLMDQIVCIRVLWIVFIDTMFWCHHSFSNVVFCHFHISVITQNESYTKKTISRIETTIEFMNKTKITYWTKDVNRYCKREMNLLKDNNKELLVYLEARKQSYEWLTPLQRWDFEIKPLAWAEDVLLRDIIRLD